MPRVFLVTTVIGVTRTVVLHRCTQRSTCTHWHTALTDIEEVDVALQAGGGRDPGRLVGQPYEGGGIRVTTHLPVTPIGDGHRPDGGAGLVEPHLQVEFILADIPGSSVHLPTHQKGDRSRLTRDDSLYLGYAMMSFSDAKYFPVYNINQCLKKDPLAFNPKVNCTERNTLFSSQVILDRNSRNT